MKKCYELIIVSKDGKSHNVIFSSMRKAAKALRSYDIGSSYMGSYIASRTIMERVLF